MDSRFRGNDGASLGRHDARPARSLGLKTGSCAIAGLDWQQLPLPALAFLRPPQPESDGTPALPHLILILKTDGNVLSYFRAGSQAPESISVEEAALRFAPEILLVAKEASVGEKEGEEICRFRHREEEIRLPLVYSRTAQA